MIVRCAIEAMGTRFEAVLDGRDAHRLRAIGELALEEVRLCHERYSLFDAGSFLSHVNAGAAQREVEVDDETLELLLTCAEVHAQSGGAFDITVAPLMRAWGFHDRDAAHSGNAESRGCTSTDVTADVPFGMADLHIDAASRSVRFARPGMAVDLGGIAKGHALDLAADVIREHGIDRALLHGGTSTVLAIGAPPGTDGWRVALAGPEPMPTTTLRDAALAVSAPHGRTIQYDGRRLGHVIDPHRGAPADGTSLAAVIAPSARLADAWSTALLALGDLPETLPEDLTALLGVDAPDGRQWRSAGADLQLFTTDPPVHV
jgi:thiamine biosynthesis lipoprotein